MAKVVYVKLLCRDLVHRTARIGYCTNLVCIELFPPIQRRRNIKVDGNHSHELPMVCAGLCQLNHKLSVVGADNYIFA